VDIAIQLKNLQFLATLMIPPASPTKKLQQTGCTHRTQHQVKLRLQPSLWNAPQSPTLWSKFDTEGQTMRPIGQPYKQRVDNNVALLDPNTLELSN